MRKIKKNRKSLRKGLSHQEKLKRKKLRMKRKERKLKESFVMKQNDDKKINLSKWIKVGKEVMGENYKSVLKLKLDNSEKIVGKYDNNLQSSVDTYLNNGDRWNTNMRDMMLMITKKFIDDSVVFRIPDSMDQIGQLVEEGLLDENENMVTEVKIEPSNILKMSKKKRGLILDGLLKHHQTLINQIDQLNELKKVGGRKDFRTQTIDIGKTNIWSCYDDFTYGLLEWLWEEKELILQCITKPIFGGIVKRIYICLGHPNNRIEIEKGCLEKLLQFIQNDNECLSQFRMKDNGMFNGEQFDITFDKDRNTLIHSWFKENLLLKKFYGGSRGKILRGSVVNFYSHQDNLYQHHTEQNPSGSLVQDRIQNGEIYTPEKDISWMGNLREDELVTIYRSVSDKNHPLGWSWTTDKLTGITWIRSRGLVKDLKKKSSYLVETQIPKKDILFVLNNYNSNNGGYTYNEVIVTKDKLKDCELKITEIDGEYDSVYEFMVGDKKIKESLIHEDVMMSIETMKSHLLDTLPIEQLKHLNEKWFIRKMWLEMSVWNTETSLGKKYNELTEEWENFDESLSLVGNMG